CLNINFKIINFFLFYFSLLLSFSLFFFAKKKREKESKVFNNCKIKKPPKRRFKKTKYAL
ncbi:MAG: hypothetical protein J6I62_00975, partial [Selenomonadaceae bacterium]|nr:hypothetical protein [Selenomonadaceae bacterium]